MEHSLLTLSDTAAQRLTPNGKHSGSSEDKEFTFNSPVNLTTADKFHMWFMYECVD